MNINLVAYIDKINAYIMKRFIHPIACLSRIRLMRYPLFGEWIYIDPRSVLLRRIIRDGEYEPSNIEILKALIPPAGRIYDLGANYGIISLAIAVARPDTSILSVEPSSDCFAGLKKTIRRFRGRQWDAVCCALSDQNGQAEFFTSHKGEDAYGGLGDTRRMSGPPLREHVPVRTLDSLWKERCSERVSFLKIDVEGYEINLLNGAKDLIATCRPHILLEISRTNLLALGISTDELFQYAEKHRYKLLNAVTMEDVSSSTKLFYQTILFEDFLMVPIPPS